MKISKAEITSCYQVFTTIVIFFFSSSSSSYQDVFFSLYIQILSVQMRLGWEPDIQVMRWDDMIRGTGFTEKKQDLNDTLLK